MSLISSHDQLFFSLLRYAVTGNREQIDNAPSEESLLSLFALAKSQDLAHPIGFALEKLGFLQEGTLRERFAKEQMLALYRYRRMDYEYQRICALFEEEGIDYMPLKGAVLRAFYPEPQMRTSCDIDLLIKEEQVKQAVSLLKTRLDYESDGKKTFHDVHARSKSGVHLELHYNIKEDIDSMDRVLSRVWDYAVKEEGFAHRYRQSPAYLIFHQIAHAAYHFIKGGCGVRPLLDLWLLREKLSYDQQTLDRLLQEAGLCCFAEKLFLLAEVWFDSATHTPLTREMEEYILGAGVYGTLENAVAMGQKKSGGKMSYLLSRVFMPYKNLKGRYPILKKYPALYPIYTVYRWGQIVFGKRELALQTIRHNSTLSEEKTERILSLKRDLGLD